MKCPWDRYGTVEERYAGALIAVWAGYGGIYETTYERAVGEIYERYMRDVCKR